MNLVCVGGVSVKGAGLPGPVSNPDREATRGKESGCLVGEQPEKTDPSYHFDSLLV